MADKIFHSSPVTFIDRTDDRKMDVYISSNHPTVQLHNTNADEYTPDWSVTKLELKASFYVDSTPITPTKIEWTSIIGTTTEVLGSNSDLYVSTNVLKDNPIITYRCSIEYQNLKAFKDITFTRVDTGVNGTDGSPAPAVQVQYSVDGTTGWTSTLNAATHKYIKYSYDGGKTWTTAIKMVGEDGTSVRIKGTATSAISVAGTDYYTLVYSGSSINSAEIGDSYLYDGDLYVCADSRDGQDYFINVGGIQGPQGNDGLSSYVFIRYATDANGTSMSTSPSGKTYIGVYTSNTNVAPTTASVYTWSKFVGDSAKSIILNGDSQVFKVSTSNVYTPATIKVTAQAFNTSVTTWTYSTNGGQTFVSTVPTGVSLSGNVVTITGSTLTTNSLVVKASDGTYSDVFTVYKAFDGANGNPGAPGTPASMAFLTNENVTFSANASGVITSATISTNVVAYNGAVKTTPTVGTIANLPTGMTATVGTVVNNEVPIVFTVTNSNLGSALNNNGSITIPVNGPVYTNLIITWSKVNSGAQGGIGPKGSDAYTVLLTNESHVFAGDVNNAIAGTAETQALAYIGATPQTVKIISVNEKTAAITDTDTGIDGLKFKCDTLSGTSPKITFTCTTAFKSASGTIPIKLSVGGVEFVKMFTYSIAFKGATGGTGGAGPKGDAATAYWLVSSASVVNKTSTGTIAVTPSTLTFTGKSQTGTNAPVDYACRWIIAYSTDGTNYTNLYTSTANEASKSITVATTYKTIRARMYMAGGTTALLDEQIIPVVSDGAKGDKGSQGDRGAGISSVTVTYGTSTSASTQPTSWQTTLPTVAEGSYLWTRTITDYTDDSITDTVTYTYAKQGKTPVKGTDYVDGTSVTVSSIQYQSSTSATTAPTGTWSNSVVTVAEGSYLWTKTTFSDGKIAYGVAKQGEKGSAGTPAPIVFLTNENISFSADVQGQITSSTVTSNIVAYNGTTKVLPTIGTITGAPSGMTITTSNSNNEVVMNIAISDKATLGSPSSNSGTVSIPVTSPVNTTLRLTWNKINTGLNGANGNDAVVFQVYSENGYVLHKDVPNITLRTFAYIGDVPIEAEAAYQWYKYNDGNWVAISNAIDSSFEVAHTDISYSGSYMCKMLFNGVEYVSVVTIDDKNDTNIVFTSKPSSYMTGDIWIVSSDYQPYQYMIATTFDSGTTYYSNTSGKVANPQPTNKDAIKNGLYYIYAKAEIGTILRSEHTGNVYSDDDWISATRYDKQLQEIQSDISDYNQYFSFNKEQGLVIGAKDENGVHSKFSTSLSNTQLSFNYEGEAVAYINGSKMNIKEAEIESPLTVTGKYSNGVIQQPPIINIGNFSIVVESNGSLSIISNT